MIHYHIIIFVKYSAKSLPTADIIKQNKMYSLKFPLNTTYFMHITLNNIKYQNNIIKIF